MSLLVTMKAERRVKFVPSAAVLNFLVVFGVDVEPGTVPDRDHDFRRHLEPVGYFLRYVHWFTYQKLVDLLRRFDLIRQHRLSLLCLSLLLDILSILPYIWRWLPVLRSRPLLRTSLLRATFLSQVQFGFIVFVHICFD